MRFSRPGLLCVNLRRGGVLLERRWHRIPLYSVIRDMQAQVRAKSFALLALAWAARQASPCKRRRPFTSFRTGKPPHSQKNRAAIQRCDSRRWFGRSATREVAKVEF